MSRITQGEIIRIRPQIQVYKLQISHFFVDLSRWRGRGRKRGLDDE